MYFKIIKNLGNEVMSADFKTIDDFDIRCKRVLVRIDINSPVDPNTGIILDDSRIKGHVETIEELSKKGAKVILLAHQSRPGKSDFTTLRQHADRLTQILGIEVKYVDGIFSIDAINAIENLIDGDILLLENVRFFSEESLSRSPEEQSKTLFVSTLTPYIDIFINDAFATAHRSHLSLVGFTKVVPSAAGRVMEKEVRIITQAIENSERPCVFVLGGVKADDSIEVIENVLKNKTADSVLTTGLVANIFLKGAGVDIAEINENFIKSKDYYYLVDKAKELIEKYGDKIIYPEDVAVEDNGNRLDVDINNIPNKPIFDVGVKTIKKYEDTIKNAKTIFANGPAGVFEDSKFSAGTDDILNAIADSPAFTVVGGGHIGAAAVAMGLDDKIEHISSGGGASISLLAGKKLAAVEALKDAK
ncbi:MAG: phosphoglycerate kinase [Methanobrevibacter sp.]|jgi:phosphoglycerate kinase|nr:phosphoglycerate kinase [Candidatus Methanovirga australis]